MSERNKKEELEWKLSSLEEEKKKLEETLKDTKREIKNIKAELEPLQDMSREEVLKMQYEELPEIMQDIIEVIGSTGEDRYSGIKEKVLGRGSKAKDYKYWMLYRYDWKGTVQRLVRPFPNMHPAYYLTQLGKDLYCAEFGKEPVKTESDLMEEKYGDALTGYYLEYLAKRINQKNPKLKAECIGAEKNIRPCISLEGGDADLILMEDNVYGLARHYRRFEQEYPEVHFAIMTREEDLAKKIRKTFSDEPALTPPVSIFSCSTIIRKEKEELNSGKE